MSQFRASRLAESFNTSGPSPQSYSLESTVLPASSAKTLQKSIRLGKLDDQGRLIGGEDGESDSEDDDGTMQEILELLRKGEVHNAGPDGPHQFVAPQAPIEKPTKPLPEKPKTSRFKLARSEAGLLSSRQPVAPPVVERKVPAVVERQMPVARPAPAPVSKPVVIESPSFPQGPKTTRLTRPPTVMTKSVSERTSGQSARIQPPAAQEQKMSRFMSSRMDEEESE